MAKLDYVNAKSSRVQDFDPYFRMFRKTCERAKLDRHVVETLGDLIALVEILKGLRGRSQAYLCRRVRGEFGNFQTNTVS